MGSREVLAPLANFFGEESGSSFFAREREYKGIAVDNGPLITCQMRSVNFF